MEAYDNFRIVMTIFISLVLNSMLSCVKYDPPISHSIIDLLRQLLVPKIQLKLPVMRPSITLMVYLFWIFWVWAQLSWNKLLNRN